MNRKSFFLLIFAIFSVSAISAKQPKWIESPQSAYPANEYVSAVGSGTDRDSAQSAAKLALCQILGERISGELSVMQSADSAGSEFAKLDISVQERVIFEKIVGVTIRENYSQKEKISVKENGKTVTKKVKVHYALAVLKKSEAALYYSSQVHSRAGDVSSNLERARANPGKISSVALAKNALSLAEENEYDIQILSAIQGMRQAVSYGSVQKVRNELRSVSEKVRVRVSVTGSKDDGTEKISQKFKSVISDFGFTVSADENFGYILKCDLDFEPIDGANLAKNSDGSAYRYVRYTLSAELVDADGGEVAASYSTSGREGHLTDSQAKTRAIQKICTKIETEFLQNL